jgi:hypothetical protein
MPNSADASSNAASLSLVNRAYTSSRVGARWTIQQSLFNCSGRKDGIQLAFLAGWRRLSVSYRCHKRLSWRRLFDNAKSLEEPVVTTWRAFHSDAVLQQVMRWQYLTAAPFWIGK